MFAPIVTGCVPWKMTVSEMVVVGSALTGAFGGPEGVDEVRCVADGGLRVAIVFVQCSEGIFLYLKVNLSWRSRGGAEGGGRRAEWSGQDTTISFPTAC